LALFVLGGNIKQVLERSEGFNIIIFNFMNYFMVAEAMKPAVGWLENTR
jgi:hypothetical protein